MLHRSATSTAATPALRSCFVYKENHCVQKLEVALTQILTRKIARLVLPNIVRSHADGNRLVAELQFAITALARYGVPAETMHVCGARTVSRT